MPSYASEVTHQYHVFEGTVASITTRPTNNPLGGKLVSQKVKTAPGAYGADVEHYEGPDGTHVTPGAVFRCQVIETAPGTFTYGPWQFFGYIHEEKVKSLNALNPNRVAKAAAGQPMINPHGWPIILADGTQPNQPASGEPARDEWTGALTGETEP